MDYKTVDCQYILFSARCYIFQKFPKGNYLDNSCEPVSNQKNANKGCENNSASLQQTLSKYSVKQTQKCMQFTSQI